MAFKFNWTSFDDKFINYARDQLSKALNKGIKTEMIGAIKVKELYMGTKPPDLEVLEIADLSEEKFKGIFQIKYQGDAYIVIQTTVQVNPLVVPKMDTNLIIGSGVVAANQPLDVPMQLRISNLRLSGIAALVLYSNKGVTFCFKNDPLENIQVSSSFDNVPTIRKFINNLIKTQISSFLLDDIPNIIHTFSLEKMEHKNQKNKERSNSFDSSVPNSPNLGSEKSISGSTSSSSSATLVNSNTSSENNIMGSLSPSTASTTSNLFAANESYGSDYDLIDFSKRWKGNDLSSANLKNAFENRLILYRGLKCLKSLQSNPGILRLLHPNTLYLAKYLVQNINLNTWLLSPPFAPVSLNIPIPSQASYYHTYNKDKHFSILDYLRSTAVTKNQRNYYSLEGSGHASVINNNDGGHHLTIPQENDLLSYYDEKNPSHSPMVETTATPTSSIINSTSDTTYINSNSSVTTANESSILKDKYSYTHTYHKGQRKSKMTKSQDKKEDEENYEVEEEEKEEKVGEIKNKDHQEVEEESKNTVSKPIDIEGRSYFSSGLFSGAKINKFNLSGSSGNTLEPPTLLPRSINTVVKAPYANNNNNYPYYLNRPSTPRQNYSTPTASSFINNINNDNASFTTTSNSSSPILPTVNTNQIITSTPSYYGRSSHTAVRTNSVDRKNPNTNATNYPINNISSGYSSDGESTVCEEFPSEIVIEPSNNSMAAQLTTLMNSNQTISPYTRTLEHFAYRSFPHSPSPLQPSNGNGGNNNSTNGHNHHHSYRNSSGGSSDNDNYSYASYSMNNRRRSRSLRQRRRLKIRVDGLISNNNGDSSTLNKKTNHSISMPPRHTNDFALGDEVRHCPCPVTRSKPTTGLLSEHNNIEDSQSGFSDHRMPTTIRRSLSPIEDTISNFSSGLEF